VRYLISVDVGTQGSKAAIVDEEGRIVATSFRPSQLIRMAGGRVEQDPEEIFDSVLLGIKEVMEKSNINRERVAAIGIDGQMAGILAIDRDWNPVIPYDSWLDTRCEKVMQHMKDWGEQSLIRTTGAPVTYAHGAKKVWWRTEQPDVYARIAKFIVISAYVSGKLAGLNAEQAYIDYSHLHFSGFADVETMVWSDELLHAFGIDRDKMPSIVQPWDIIGTLTSDYAEITGLMKGTPIVAGSGDTAATLLGAGIVRPGQLIDIAGTASVLSCCIDRYEPDAKSKTLIYARSIIPGLWTPLAYINGGGQCLAWFREQWNLSKSSSLSFDELNRMAEAVESGSDGLLFVPHFGGRVCPNNPDLRGSWIGLNWAHDKGAMYRSIMEAIAYEYRYYLSTLEGLTGTISYSHVHAVGGGASSALFNQIKSDVLNIPYQTLHESNSALVANAVIAGYGVGLFNDLASTASRFVSVKENYAPDAQRHQIYKKFADRYPVMLEQMSSLYNQFK